MTSWDQARWRKSGFSDENTNCVVVAWRKSTFSGENTEVPPLTFPARAWHTFLGNR